MKHETIGFSTTARWSKCSGSIFMKLKFPIQEESEAMAEGTAYHEGVEHVLKDYIYNGFSLDEAHKIHNDKYLNDEMRELVLQTCQEIRKQIEAIGAKKIEKLGIEEKIMLSEALNCGGILDFCYIVNTGKERVFVAWDHKYGRKLVEAEGNLQLVAGACAAHSSEKWGSFDRAVLHIYQPRAEHPEGPLRRMKLRREDIEDWSAKLTEMAEKINRELENEAPTFNPGDHCDWCPGNGNCTAQLKAAEAAAGVEFLPVEVEETPQLPDPATLTPEQKETLVLYTKPLESFLKAVNASVLKEMNTNGAEYSKLKLVRGRTRRAWKDVDKVVEVLEGAGMEKPYEIKPCTLNAVTKALGKKAAEEIFAEHTEKPEGQVQVAPLSDQRAAIEPQTKIAEEEFKNENSSDDS